MGVSVLTALTVQNPENDIRCQAGGPVNGKWAGWITLYKDEMYHRPLLSTEPVYDSEADAKRAMEKTVEEIRKLVIA